ncbi:MAG: hypothetical protein ACRERE_07905 [Candidatus Entotheonellia bacterium]
MARSGDQPQHEENFSEAQTLRRAPATHQIIYKLLGFTANDCPDIGADLGSPVSEACYDKAPFTFNGKIEQVQVKYSQE